MVCVDSAYKDGCVYGCECTEDQNCMILNDKFSKDIRFLILILCAWRGIHAFITKVCIQADVMWLNGWRCM